MHEQPQEKGQNLPEIDPLIPFRQAIMMAGMRTTKGYAEVAAGRLVVVKNGRNTFIRASELSRYLDALAANSVTGGSSR